PSVLYAPGADNLQRRFPNVATRGSEIEIAVTFNEPIAANVAPTLVAVNGTDELNFSPTVLESPFFVFTTVVPETFTGNGDYEIRVEATDTAGNATAEPIVPGATVTLDSTAPPAPTNLRLLRRPWGASDLCSASTQLSADTDGPVSSEVETDDADGVLTTLVVFDRPPSEGDRVEIGRATLEPSGTLTPFSLNTGDRIDAYALLIDEAGNESAAARVDKGRWYGNLNGRRTGDDFSNPSRLTRVSLAEPALISSLGTEPLSSELEASYSCPPNPERLALDTERPWTRLDGPSLPSVQLAGFAYMASNSRAFLFGGLSNDATTNNLFEWNGVRWRQVDLVGVSAPPAVVGPSMSYDPIRDRVVLFGGGSGFSTFNSDVWEWDATQWTRVSTTGNAPFSGLALPMAFDAGRGRTTLFGDLREPANCGSLAPVTLLGGACVSRDVWTWDGSEWDSVCDA
ncbi:MAG: hypothetical protein AAFQ82_24595, partial [Myxococcota bacterium]